MILCLLMALKYESNIEYRSFFSLNVYIQHSIQVRSFVYSMNPTNHISRVCNEIYYRRQPKYIPCSERNNHPWTPRHAYISLINHPTPARRHTSPHPADQPEAPLQTAPPAPRH